MSKKESKEKLEKEKFHRMFRRRYCWKITVVVLFALLIISIFSGGFKDFFKASVGSQKVAEEAVEFINTNLLQGDRAMLKGVAELNSLYIIELEVGGQEFESYVTKDGKFLFPSGIDMTEKIETVTTPTGAATTDCEDTPKSKKPSVDVFVMSHCPFGTQIEKGMLPVLKLFKNKIDFNLRFVYYAMHGEKEVKEQLNQYCIQKEQNDKLIDYLYCFLEKGESTPCLAEAKIDTKKLEACTEVADKEFKITEKLNDQSTWLNGRFPLFDVDKELNTKYGIGGSPSLVINGQTASSGRDPASLLNAICCAFDEKPAECKETLSTTAPSPGFGLSNTGSGSGGSCG